MKDNVLPKLPPKNIFTHDLVQRRKLLQDYVQSILNHEIFLIKDVFNFFELENQFNLKPNKIDSRKLSANIFQINKIISENERPYTTYLFLIKSDKFSF